MSSSTPDNSVHKVRRLLWSMTALAVIAGGVSLSSVSSNLQYIESLHSSAETTRGDALTSVEALRTYRVQMTAMQQQLLLSSCDIATLNASNINFKPKPFADKLVAESIDKARCCIIELGGVEHWGMDSLQTLSQNLLEVHVALESSWQKATNAAQTSRQCSQAELEVRKTLAEIDSMIAKTVGKQQLFIARQMATLATNRQDQGQTRLKQLVEGFRASYQPRQLNSDLRDLALLAEQLFATQDIDKMRSLKDNQLRQTLARLERNGKRLPEGKERFLAQLQSFREGLFGAGSQDDPRHQTMTCTGGLYQQKQELIRQIRTLRETTQHAEELANQCRSEERQLHDTVAELSSRVALENDGRLRSASQTLFVVAGVASAIFLLGASRIIGLVCGAMRESSNRQLELDRLLEEAERRKVLIDAVLHSVAEGIVAADETGKFLCFNNSAERILGEKLLEDTNLDGWTYGFGLFEMDGDTPIAKEDTPLFSAINGETISNREILVRRSDGDVAISVNATPLSSDEHGGGVVTFRDVTKQRQLTQQLSQAQKLESIGQLAAGVAHEINTPMQFVSDNIHFLKDCVTGLFEVIETHENNLRGTNAKKSWEQRLAEIDEVTKRCRFDWIQKQIPLAIEECLEGVQRVVAIVRAMKEFSHPGTVEKVSTDVNEAIRSTLTISKNRWKYAADIELDLGEDLPDVKTLPAELNQVLLNLVVNAGDAIAEKLGENSGKKGVIAISTSATESHLVIQISDDGCGIPEEIRRKIFDPFFTTKEVGKGTGQGLSISYDVVVNKHQGKLELDSTIGEGSVFRICLPLRCESGPVEPQEDGLNVEQLIEA